MTWRRPTKHAVPLLAGLLAAMGCIPTAMAESRIDPLGDLSAVSDPELLRDPTTECETCTLSAAPHEWDEPILEADWSFGLRGAYVRNADGEQYQIQALPRFSLRRDTMRGGYGISAEALLSRSSRGDYHVDEVSLALDAEHALDAATALRGTFDFALSQDRPGSPGVASDVVAAPLVGSGTVEVALERRFGPLSGEGRLAAARELLGPTMLADGSQRDNSAQNNWRLNGGLRLGYAVTPIITVFVDGSVGHQLYDAASPIHLARLDATDYEVRAGLAAGWREVLEAEASLGLGLRRFAEAALGETTAVLYDASVTFRPDETVTLGADFSTRFGTPGANAAGTARLEYRAAATASYRVNPWLLLRASGGWSLAQQIGTDGSEQRYSMGAGLDYTLNQHAALTADYEYAHARPTPNAGEDEQRVTLGVTFSR